MRGLRKHQLLFPQKQEKTQGAQAGVEKILQKMSQTYSP